ncbi:MAG: LytR family transcriptional regulator [Gemmatimonadales bacterium]|nr:MAG: LytR family transcriptional regulator [Gemmatimonadales bacterium]
MGLAVLAAVVVAGLMVGAHLFDEAPEPVEVVASLDRAVPEPPASWSRIRVEVLNGAGIQGLAARARDLLREEGFDVVSHGNADTFDHEETRILARTNDEDGARAVADRLGFDGIELAPDSTRYADVTVILGRDWDPQRPAQGADEPSESDGLSRWDPRRLLDRDGVTHENP